MSQLFLWKWLCEGTIDYYKCLWTKGILQYMSDKGIDMYTPDVGAKL